MSSKKLPYSNLTPKQKREHLVILEDAVLRTKDNLKYWESSLAQLKSEMKS